MNYEETTVVSENPAEIAAPENMLLGIIGALVGAIIGGLSIVLLSQMGYVASISGVVLAFCTLKGYELLGKALSKKGIVICIILMVLTPFIADWICWALVVMEAWAEYGVTFTEAFVTVPLLLQDGTIALADYLKDLGMLYLFVVLGGFYTVRNALKSE